MMFFFLLVDEGWEDQNTTIILMAFCQRADNGPPLNAGLVAL